MNSMREYKNYQDEIELALVQNACVECELYSIIAAILREGPNGGKISLRDVSQRRKSPISARLMGDAGFPDFVILKRVKYDNAGVLGCIEIKSPHVNLSPDAMSDRNIQQLHLHIRSYDKVLYTNGLVWRFYADRSEHAEWEYKLGEFKGGTIIWDSDETWRNLLNDLDTIVQQQV